MANFIEIKMKLHFPVLAETRNVVFGLIEGGNICILVFYFLHLMMFVIITLLYFN